MPLNTEVQDVNAMVTALQSLNHGDIQSATIGDTETGGGESHAKEEPPACEVSELPWNVVGRKRKMSNGRNTANTTTLGNVSPLTQHDLKQSKQPKHVPVNLGHIAVAGALGTLWVLGKVPSDAVLVKRKYKNTKLLGTIPNGSYAGGLLSGER